jgi:hypothetical protein
VATVRIPIRDATGNIVKVIEADEKTDAALLGRINQLEAENAELLARLCGSEALTYKALRGRIAHLEAENADVRGRLGETVAITAGLMTESATLTGALVGALIESTSRAAHANRLAVLNASLVENLKMRESVLGPAPHDLPPRRRRKKLTEAQLYAQAYRRVNAGAPA